MRPVTYRSLYGPSRSIATHFENASVLGHFSRCEAPLIPALRQRGVCDAPEDAIDEFRGATLTFEEMLVHLHGILPRAESLTQLGLHHPAHDAENDLHILATFRFLKLTLQARERGLRLLLFADRDEGSPSIYRRSTFRVHQATHDAFDNVLRSLRFL